MPLLVRVLILRVIEFLLEKPKDFPMGIVTMTNAITGLRKCRRPEQAVKMFEYSKKLGLKPSVVTYSSVITACEKGRMMQKAFEVFNAC